MSRRFLGGARVPLIALGLLAAALAVFPTVSSGEGDVPPKAFDTPEALAEAMVAAAKDNSDDAIKALVGSENADLIQPGGDPSVARVRAEFAAKAAEFWKLDDNEDGSMTLVIGDNRWPYPVPLVKGASGWSLDVAAGRDEMLARRIGRNELNAIKLVREYVRAQREYASKDRDGDGVREYAQLVRSTEGNKDGLYWPEGDDGDISPFGPLVASAREYLQDRNAKDPVGGYYWRILTGQGREAPGGCHSYIINGNMIAGFALIGFPADYRKTGVMTFLVSHHGDVLEKDLGADTAAIASSVDYYNPDDQWQKVED